MAKKTVDLTIRLKDGVTGVLGKIGSGLKRTATAFKGVAIAGVAATTAIIGGLTALAKAYSDQESVNKRMKDTFDAAGESGAKAVAKWGAFATTLQRVTTLGDEEIMNLISLAKTMGIANDEIEDATKGAIGLSKAFGIDLNSSMKMVALATQGEYTMLQRYIPELRAATDEAEKAAIVHEAMARGFKVASGELDTLKGQWVALKGVVGDAMQEIGRVLFGDGGLTRGLEQVKNKIIELTEGGAITKWAEQAKAGLDAVVDTIKIISKGGQGRSEVLGAVGNVIKQSFKSAAITAMEVMLNVAPKVGMAIAKGIAEVTGIQLKTPELRAQEKITKTARQEYNDARLNDRDIWGRDKGSPEVLALKKALTDSLITESQMRNAFNDSTLVTGIVDDLPKAIDEFSEVLRKFGSESEPNRKKLAAEMGLRVQNGAKEGSKKGTEAGAKEGIKTSAIIGSGGITKDTINKGLNGDDLKGSKEFIKTLMRGQEGLSRRQSLGVVRELLKSGGAGQLGPANDILKKLMQGQSGLSQKDALGVLRQLIQGGGLGEGESITDLIDQLSGGQDGMSRADISRALLNFYGGGSPAGGLAEGGMLGDTVMPSVSSSDESVTTNDLLKQIAKNTAGGLF